ncbi:unnamed protein product [Jaminaea pallidilutea]
MTDQGSFDYLFKVIIIGSSSTGKSTLLHHFAHREFISKSHTVGVEFTSRRLVLPPTDEGQNEGGGHASSKSPAVKLQIWDSAGQERFRSVVKSYYRGAIGCLLVYDVTRRSTFADLPAWLADVRSLASDHLVVIVVGNKTDLATTSSSSDPDSSSQGGQKDREVSFEEAKEWATSEGLPLVETSSLTGDNVQSPFELCARGVLDLVQGGVVNPDEQGSGVSYGDRALRPGHSRSSSTTTTAGGPNQRLSFVDIVQSGGGVSRRTARGTAPNAGGMVRLKEALGMERDGGCC